MSVVIRLTRQGRHKLPFYRMVVADKEFPRDGRYLELVGRVNTLTNPTTITIKEDRIRHWIGQGALPSDTVRQILAKEVPGFFEELVTKRLNKIKARRKARKARGGSKKREMSPGKARRKAAKKAAKLKPKTAPKKEAAATAA